MNLVKKNKTIKVKFKKIGGFDLWEFFPFRVLMNNFNIEVVNGENEADIIYEVVCRDGDYDSLNRDGRIIIISFEDLLAKRNIFNLVETCIGKLGFRDKKWKIMDELDNVIPNCISGIPIFYFLPKYLEFVKKIKYGVKKNGYAIIQNNIKNKNLFILPYFLQGYYSDMSKLIKKRGYSGKRENFCAFVVSSNSSRERVDFFKRLSRYKKIDSYGKVMNNMGDEMQRLNYLSNPDLFKKYKFVICFENDFHDEYITEKLINVMLAGAIPIYRGALNVGEYFNTKSFINYDDYGSYEKMIEKVIELDNDDTKYNKMLREPWFKGNKIPKIIKEKEKDLIKFYKKII
jgi:hypothetical protein